MEFFGVCERINKWIADAVCVLIYAKQDEYFTKGDFVYEPSMMIKRG